MVSFWPPQRVNSHQEGVRHGAPGIAIKVPRDHEITEVKNLVILRFQDKRLVAFDGGKKNKTKH